MAVPHHMILKVQVRRHLRSLPLPTPAMETNLMPQVVFLRCPVHRQQHRCHSVSRPVDDTDGIDPVAERPTEPHRAAVTTAPLRQLQRVPSAWRCR